MNSAQIAAFVFGILATGFISATCFWNTWAVTSGPGSSSILNSIWGFNGIWMQCLQYTTNQFQCEMNAMKSLFEIPSKFIFVLPQHFESDTKLI